MIYSGKIKKTLRFLDAEYKKHTGHAHEERPILLSKLALLEVCGWIEGAFDEIAYNGVRGESNHKGCNALLRKQVPNVAGFVYASKAQPLIQSSIGVHRLLKMEKQLDKNGSLQILKSALGTLNKERRIAAHEMTVGSTHSYSSPSISIAHFETVEPILLEMWRLVKKH